MSRTPLIEKPTVFGHMDVDDLIEIGNLLDSDSAELRTKFYPRDRNISSNPSALLSLAKNLFNYADTTLDMVPNRVDFDIDTDTVPPNQSQRRAKYWHVDDPDDDSHVACAVLVSSALPTEFLVPGPHYEEFLHNQKVAPWVTAREMLMPALIGIRIKEGALDIYTPAPGEVVMITNHVHRSPNNNTARTINRVWMRGWLEELRGVDC